MRISRALQFVSPLLATSLLLCAPALADDHGQRKAHAVAFDDHSIEWSPCPEFFGEGCRIGVLQGDPAKPNADIFFKVPPGAQVPHHWHTSAERMVLVSGTFHVQYDGQPAVVMQPGTYAYGPAKLPHSGHCAEGDPCVLFIAFEAPVDAVPTEAE